MLKNTINPALVLDKHMIPCRDENEKRLLYAYLSKKRELAEHLSQVIYVLKKIFYRKHHVINRFFTVHMVINRNKTYFLFRKITLNISSGFQIISSESGQILYDHTINKSLFNICNHSLKIRTFKS